MTAVLPAPRDGVATHYLSGTGALSAPTLNLLAPPTGPVDLNSQRLTNLDAPQGPTDAATKAYADALAAGLDPKDSVRAATTANITLSGAQTIDGVAAIAGNRVLVKNQTTGSENGIYVVAAGAWSRSPDANSDPEVTAGLYVFVEEGAQADTGWVLTTNNPITLGTTSLSFTQFSGGGGGAASDATLTFSDITTGNATAGRHGFLPKVTGNRSHYLAGDGGFAPMGNTFNQWYVDAGSAPSGADGRTPRGAFPTFAAAIAVAQPYDNIYVCSNLTENLVIPTQGVSVIGLGRPIIGSSGTSINDITINCQHHSIQLANFIIRGNANFKGTHLKLMDRFNISRIEIDGTAGAATPTFYPTSPGAGTGIGGVGVLMHHGENGISNDLYVKNCSMGIVHGTWSTGNIFIRTGLYVNAQSLVIGMATGVYTNYLTPAAGPWPYGNSGTAESQQCGHTVYERLGVFSVAIASSTVPNVDLIGDGTTNFGGQNGGNNTFTNFEAAEGLSPVVVRIGTRGNKLIDFSTATGTQVKFEGTHNHIISGMNASVFTFLSDRNVVDNMCTEGGFYGGSGDYNTFRNIDFDQSVWNFVGASGNVYDNCRWNLATGVTLADLGGSPVLRGADSLYGLTYGTTIPVDVGYSGYFTLHVTGAAGTIQNPTDARGSGAIMRTAPITFNIRSTAATHGIVSVGSKYVVQGGGTTLFAAGAIANGKYRAVIFNYHWFDDKWYEQSRSPSDIG